jgi:hypothetical protein
MRRSLTEKKKRVGKKIERTSSILRRSYCRCLMLLHKALFSKNKKIGKIPG